MKYPAVDDLVAPRGTLDLIWAGGPGFGPCRSCRGAALDPGAGPYRGGWPHPFASQPGRLREDANRRNSGNGEDYRE